MPRELTAAEVVTFKAGHPEIDRALSPQSYADLNRIPEHGLAVLDGSRYVLVWKDAVAKWHFIDLTGAPQMEELSKNKPEFVSPDSSLIDSIWSQLAKVGQGAEDTVQKLVKAVALMVVIFVAVELISVGKLLR